MKNSIRKIIILAAFSALYPTLVNAAQKATIQDNDDHFCIIKPSKAGGDESFCYTKDDEKNFYLKEDFIINVPENLSPVDQNENPVEVTYCQYYVTDEPCITLGNGTIKMQKGFIWNGKSGPGNPENPKTLRATLVHDALYELMRERKICDEDAADKNGNNKTKNARKAADAFAGLLICEDGGNAEATAWGVHVGGKFAVNNGKDKLCNENSYIVAGQTEGPSNSIKCGKENDKNLARYKNVNCQNRDNSCEKWLVWESFGYN